MMRWSGLLLGAAFLAALAGTAASQPAARPFDMGAERPPDAEIVTPVTPVVPANRDTPAILANPAEFGGLRLNTVPAVEAPAPDALAPVTGNDPYVRPIIPYGELSLTGEEANSTWSVYLTQRQAASPATLHVGYLNALLVAPENSTLRVLINDRQVIGEAIAASADPADLAVDIPTGLLNAGLNRIRIEATQRHRTDCTIESTYDLWTEIDPLVTALVFTDPRAGEIERVADLPAVGVNAEGTTIINVLMPSVQQPAGARSFFRLAQGLALHIGTPSQLVRVSATDAGTAGPGVLTVILGTIDEVSAILGRPVAVAGATFLTGTAGPTLIVAGSSWAEIEIIVDSLLSPVSPPSSFERSLVATASWHLPEVPMMTGSNSFTLGALGVPTTEFSGRRYRTGFMVAMPPDLYAQAYGQARLYLDAAYAPVVLPGGHVDVYVNGNIASTVPITVRGGGIFRALEVEVPLRHFRPGVNEVEIEAIVPTAADVTCAPGVTASNASRFVLFDTTTFTVPPYGEAAQFPDLAALSGAGFPLADPDQPLSLVLGPSAESRAAAATFLARLALQAGRTFNVATVAGAANAATPFGLFVGSISQLPDRIADQVGIDNAANEIWRDQLGVAVDAPTPEVSLSTDETFARWREVLSGGGGWQGQVSSFEDWLSRTFEFSFATLRFGRAPQLDYTPSNNAGLMLAQGGLNGNGTSWTVLSAPSPESLAANTELMVLQENWNRISGQIALYRPLTGAVDTVPLTGADLIVTGAATPQNLRLVATNWLSKNLIIYGALLLGLCIVLAISTSWLLSSVGRTE